MSTFRKITRTRILGFTIVEMMVSFVVLSFVFAFLAYLTIMQGIRSNYHAKLTKAEADARNVGELIRYRLLTAEFRTTTVSKDRRSIRFNDPNLGSVTSRMRVIPYGTESAFEYDDDVSSSPPFVRRIDDIKDVVFTSQNNGSLIRAAVFTRAEPYSYPAVEIKHVVEVYLRN